MSPGGVGGRHPAQHDRRLDGVPADRDAGRRGADRSTSGLFDLGLFAGSLEPLARAAACGLPGFPRWSRPGRWWARCPEGRPARRASRPGTPVVAGGLDTARAWPSLGSAVPGRLTVTGGSFWKQTVVAVSRPPWSRPCPPAHHLPYPAGPVAGGGDQLLRRIRAALAPGPRGPRAGPAGRPAGLRRAGGTGGGGAARGTRPHRAAGPGRRLDLGAAGSRRSRPRADASRPGWASRRGPSRRPPPTPPAVTAGLVSEMPGPRRLAARSILTGGAARTAPPAADSRRRARQPGQRAGSRRVRGRRRRRPGRPRGRGPVTRAPRRTIRRGRAGAPRAPGGWRTQAQPGRHAYDLLYERWATCRRDTSPR